MKSQLFLVIGIILFLSGCVSEGGTEYMTTQKAAGYFEEVKRI